MPNLLRICLGIAAIAGIVSVSLWRELQTERRMVEELRAQLADASAAAARPDTHPAASPQPPPAEAGRIDAADPRPAAPAPAEPAAVPALAQQTSSLQSQERALLDDPAYRKARLSLLKLNMLRQYPGLAEELGLSDAEADALITVLAENQLERSALVIPEEAYVAGQPSPRLRAAEESDARMEARIATVLGTARYGQWEDYRNTRHERRRVASLSATLVQAGAQPLSASQTRALTAVMQTELKLRNQDSWARMSGGAGLEEQRLSRQNALEVQSESDRRILAAAAPLLSAAQLSALRAQFEQEDTMRRTAFRLQSARAASVPASQPVH